jgi:hypothetical protein
MNLLRNGMNHCFNEMHQQPRDNRLLFSEKKKNIKMRSWKEMLEFTNKTNLISYDKYRRNN